MPVTFDCAPGHQPHPFPARTCKPGKCDDRTMQLIRKHVLIIALILFGTLNSNSFAQEVEKENIPSEILKAVELRQFANLYSLDGSLNPFYLRGDFDGDGKADYAFRIKSKANHASGIGIWLSSKRKLIILGAGIQFKVSGSAVSNLDFFDTWQVYGKRRVRRGVESGLPPRLTAEAILLGKRESASGLIYWNGKTFVWYQQGD